MLEGHAFSFEGSVIGRGSKLGQTGHDAAAWAFLVLPG